jgi:hypothetical protein
MNLNVIALLPKKALKSNGIEASEKDRTRS